jgi:ribosomal protein L11 methyltransferase
VAWTEVTLRLRAESCLEAEALLELAGAASISISDDGDTPILEPEPGSAPLWPTLTVRALFDDRIDSDALRQLFGSIGAAELAIERLDRETLAKARPEPIEPLEIGARLRIVPAEAFVPGDERSVGLHMGLAFGTGCHPTTRLCLAWIERELASGMKVLDYGTGSGVLALAALKLGADAVTAIDNEPQALVAAAENATLNGFEDALRTGLPESLADGPFDLILANILARPLTDLAQYFAGLQAPGGSIVLSGILDAQVDAVEASYAPFYEDFERRTLDGWSLLTGIRGRRYDP